MRARKRLAFGLRTYSNLNAQRARARIDNRIFDAEMAGEGEYYIVSPRIRQLVKQAEDSIEAAYQADMELASQAYDDMPYPDEIEDHEISAANWCECGLPRGACHRHGLGRSWENERGSPF
jgi:hypothetical protein